MPLLKVPHTCSKRQLKTTTREWRPWTQKCTTHLQQTGPKTQNALRRTARRRQFNTTETELKNQTGPTLLTSATVPDKQDVVQLKTACNPIYSHILGYGSSRYRIPEKLHRVKYQKSDYLCCHMLLSHSPHHTCNLITDNCPLLWKHALLHSAQLALPLPLPLLAHQGFQKHGYSSVSARVPKQVPHQAHSE